MQNIKKKSKSRVKPLKKVKNVAPEATLNPKTEVVETKTPVEPINDLNANKQGFSLFSIFSWFIDKNNRIMVYCIIALIGFGFMTYQNKLKTEALKIAYLNPAKKAELKKNVNKTKREQKDKQIKETKFDSQGRIISIKETKETDVSDTHTDVALTKKEESTPIINQLSNPRISLIGAYDILDGQLNIGAMYRPIDTLPIRLGIMTLVYPTFKFSPHLLVNIDF